MLEQAVQMRLRGERFFSRFTFTHPGLIRVLKTAAEHLDLDDTEQRRIAFERLAKLEGISDARGRPIRSTANDRTRAATLGLIARLSEAPLVCTQEERRVFELLFERVLEGGFEAMMTSPSPSGFVPDAIERSMRRETFVVWAPLEPAWRTALAVYALDQLPMDLVVVCRDGMLPNVRARFARPQEASTILSRARAVLDLSVNDPGDALSLATLGAPLAVSYLSGAYELLEGVAIYRAWMQDDIQRAAQTALGLSSPRITRSPAGEPVLHEPNSDGPSVASAGDVSALEGQTYRNITGDGDGVYIAEIPHGAALFDTHVALLVEAIERSGADSVTSDGVRRIADEPGYALSEGAFTLRRVRTRGAFTARVQRVTGVLAP